MLKSWLLLRANELLGQNLLVVGSKGFLAESVIGRKRHRLLRAAGPSMGITPSIR